MSRVKDSLQYFLSSSQRIFSYRSEALWAETNTIKAMTGCDPVAFPEPRPKKEGPQDGEVAIDRKPASLAFQCTRSKANLVTRSTFGATKALDRI